MKNSKNSRQKRREDNIITQTRSELKRLGNVYCEVACTELIAPEMDRDKNRNFSGINWEEIVKN